MLESNDKEIAALKELNAALKNDKNSLESILFETQNNLEASEIKRETLERDVEELLSRQVTMIVSIRNGTSRHVHIGGTSGHI